MQSRDPEVKRRLKSEAIRIRREKAARSRGYETEDVQLDGRQVMDLLDENERLRAEARRVAREAQARGDLQ